MAQQFKIIREENYSQNKKALISAEGEPLNLPDAFLYEQVTVCCDSTLHALPALPNLLKFSFKFWLFELGNM